MGRRVGPRAVRIKAWRQEGMWPSQGTRCTLVWVELRAGYRLNMTLETRNLAFILNAKGDIQEIYAGDSDQLYISVDCSAHIVENTSCSSPCKGW